jgi:hypothetical protein
MDPDRRNAMGRLARERIDTHFPLLNRKHALDDLIEGKLDQ